MQKEGDIDRVASILSTMSNTILFLDTCVMLDIFRVVERANSFNPFKVYVELAERVRNKEVTIVFNETIQCEFRYNAPKVVEEQRKKIKNLNNLWNAFRSMKNKTNVLYNQELSEDKIINSAESTLNAICKDALIVKDYNDAALRSSYDVVLNHKAPAVRDSQFKDAYIFRTCLDLAAKSGKQIIFCTTNTKDYCDGSNKIHPEIVSQSNAHNVIVTTTIGEAYKLIKNPPEENIYSDNE